MEKYIRYSNTRVIDNDSEIYQPLFEKRNVSHIIHYAMGGLRQPTDAELAQFSVSKEEWKQGDKLWKYAAKHYNGRGHYWWVIAHFNGTPTDQHFQLGDVVYIPGPLEVVLRSFGL